MPFDCAPIIEAPRPRSPAADGLDFSATPSAERVRARPVPNWHVSRQAKCLGDAVTVLAEARELLSDEQRWCKRSFARTWLGIPVPTRSGLARRYCALGAIMRVGRKLGLPVNDAHRALEWQTVRPIPDWNIAAAGRSQRAPRNAIPARKAAAGSVGYLSHGEPSRRISKNCVTRTRGVGGLDSPTSPCGTRTSTTRPFGQS
jgi:hypothetical protein